MISLISMFIFSIIRFYIRQCVVSNIDLTADIPTSVMTCMAVTPITQTAPVGLAVPVNQLVGTVTVPSEPDNSQYVIIATWLV